MHENLSMRDKVRENLPMWKLVRRVKMNAATIDPVADSLAGAARPQTVEGVLYFRLEDQSYVWVENVASLRGKYSRKQVAIVQIDVDWNYHVAGNDLKHLPLLLSALFVFIREGSTEVTDFLPL